MLIMLLGWLVWLVIGAALGWAAHRVAKRRQQLPADMAVGVLGGLLGGVLFDLFGLFGLPTVTDFNPFSGIGALIGALALLFAHRLLDNNRRAVQAAERDDVAIRAAHRPAPDALRDDTEVRDADLRLGSRRVSIAAAAALIVALPLLHLLILWLRLPSVTSAPPPFGTVGTFTAGDGETLDYVFYQPDTLPDRAPLLVLLHGCTQTPTILEAAAGMTTVADAEGFMIVYPQQNFVRSPHRCWLFWDDRNQQPEAPASESNLLRQLALHVQATNAT